MAKIGIFTPYLSTMGGGERYVLTVAEYFLKKGHVVDLFSKNDINLFEVQDRFDLDLRGVNTVPDVFYSTNCQFRKIIATSKYDLIFYLSDGSLPISFSRRTIIHFQIPFSQKIGSTLGNRLKMLGVFAVVCNSQYTKAHIDKAFGINSAVLLPPVDVEKFSAGKKENIILSVGRFFSPLHPKKQEIMVREFVDLYRRGLKDYKLVLAGGVTLDSFSEVTKLRKKSAGYPITISPNISFSQLQSLYSRAKIYWHAAGYGEDLKVHPEKAEHFGISTVEAMASGCVPIVFAGGGQVEIVKEGKTGYLWRTTAELKELTLAVAKNNLLRVEMSTAAIKDSKDYSKNHFYSQLERLTGL